MRARLTKSIGNIAAVKSRRDIRIRELLQPRRCRRLYRCTWRDYSGAPRHRKARHIHSAIVRKDSFGATRAPSHHTDGCYPRNDMPSLPQRVLLDLKQFAGLGITGHRSCLLWFSPTSKLVRLSDRLRANSDGSIEIALPRTELAVLTGISEWQSFWRLPGRLLLRWFILLL